MSSPDPQQAKRLKKVQSAIFGGYTLFSLAFVFLCVQQIASGVFGANAGPVETGGPCAKGLAGRVRDLDAAFLVAVKQPLRADALASFERGLPDANDDPLAAVCKPDPRGADAFAAVARLRLAEEDLLRRGSAEIAPVRRDVEAYLPPEAPTEPHF